MTRSRKKRYWDREESLKAGYAMTRDGRLVLNLREAVIDDGETILIGEVTTRKYRSYKKEECMYVEEHFWRFRSAWGKHGGDDLMTAPPEICVQATFRN